MRKIILTSYPYAYERYFRVFDFFKHKERLLGILPRIWKAKKGAIVVKCPTRTDIEIIPSRAFFTHSQYPVIRGLLKGWMPAIGGIIRSRAKLGDVLYTAIEPNLLTTYFNAKRAKRRGLKHVFFTWQNIPYEGRLRGLKGAITRRIVMGSIRNSAGAIAGNTAAERILRDLAGPAFPILQVPISGVDVERFNTSPSASFRSQYHLEGKIVFLFAGVFDERKGLYTLINAFKQLTSKNSDCALVLIGTGRLQDQIHDYVQKTGLVDDITIIPWLDNKELPGIFAACDVFVYPSEPFGEWQEQFGFSIAEASAAGVPVISTVSGSIPEVVSDGVTGLLVPPHSVGQLAQAMERLANESATRRAFGAAGRQFITERFSHAIVASKMEAFFDAL